jgi:hypothetical protein
VTVHPWPQVFYSSTDHEYQLGVDGVEVESFEPAQAEAPDSMTWPSVTIDCPKIAGWQVGFGRIVVSELEVPNRFANLV